MKKKLLSLLLVLCLAIGTLGALAACGDEEPTPTPTPSACTHEWNDATCTAAKTCKNCGTTEGAALGHTYLGGTCVACGTVNSAAAHTHKYTETVTQAATCTEDGTKTLACSCGVSTTLTIPAGHNYVNKTCTACGLTSTAEEIIANKFSGVSVGTVIDEVKAVYDQTPTVTIDEITKLADIFVNINGFGENVSISLKDGYVTMKNPDGGATYIGFKDGYQITVANGAVVDCTPLSIMPTTGAPEEVEAYITMIKQYAESILSYIPTFEAADLVYDEEGWYCFTDAYIERFVKGVAYLSYSFSGTELTDDKKEELDAMITGILGELDAKIGFAMDGDYVNGIIFDVKLADTTNLLGVPGSAAVNFEAKLSSDLAKLEYVRFSADAEVTDLAIDISAAFSVVPEYAADGSVTVTTALDMDISALGDEIVMDIDVSGTTNALGVPTKLNVTALVDMNCYVIDSTEINVYNSDGTSNITHTVNAVGDAKLAFTLAIDLTGVTKTASVSFSSELKNPRLAADPVEFSSGEVIEEADVIALVGEYTKEWMLKTDDDNFKYDVAASATANAGEITVTHTDVDGLSSSFTVEVEINSASSTLPPQEIIDLIQNYIPTEDDEGDGDKPSDDTPIYATFSFDSILNKVDDLSAELYTYELTVGNDAEETYGADRVLMVESMDGQKFIMAIEFADAVVAATEAEVFESAYEEMGAGDTIVVLLNDNCVLVCTNNEILNVFGLI